MIIKTFKAIVRDGEYSNLVHFLEAKKADVVHHFFETNQIMNTNVFSFQSELYVYIESIENEVTPEALFCGAEQFLEKWPDGKNMFFRPMTNIFHFNKPQSTEHWARKTKPYDCFGMIAKLIPEYISRYVFYHYQFQEEHPGGGDKYGSIFLSGDTAFYYGEMPEVYEKAQYTGALSTDNTPKGKAWQTLMGAHFVWWEETYPACNIKEYDWKQYGYPVGQRNHQWLYIKNIFSIV